MDVKVLDATERCEINNPNLQIMLPAQSWRQTADVLLISKQDVAEELKIIICFKREVDAPSFKTTACARAELSCLDGFVGGGSKPVSDTGHEGPARGCRSREDEVSGLNLQNLKD